LDVQSQLQWQQNPLPELSDKQKEIFFDLIKQGLDGTPLAYITKRQNFMDIELFCDGRALIPRKETEILGQKALQISLEIAKEKQKVNIIDVCCGLGNLSLAIAPHNNNTYVNSTDLKKLLISHKKIFHFYSSIIW
jgi:release factor glutamine methyltransferase